MNVSSSNLFTERAVVSRHSAVEASVANEHEVSVFLSYIVFLLFLFLRQHVMRPSASFFFIFHFSDCMDIVQCELDQKGLFHLQRVVFLLQRRFFPPPLC